MKRTLCLLGALISALTGLSLLLSGLAPFVQDFAALQTDPGDLTGRIFRILGGIGCGILTRLLLQMQRGRY